MADEDRSNEGPSLELPSFGLGRRKRKKSEPGDADATAPLPAVPEPREPDARPEPPPAAATRRPAERRQEDDAPTAVAPSSAIPAAEPGLTRPAEPAKTVEPAKPARARRRRSLPAVGGMVAAVVTGLLVGVVTVGLTWASQRLCELVRGTPSCGGPGFFLLVAIMVAMVLLGAALLRAWGVSDPGSTSFLAVGLLAVFALLFLVDVIFAWWMVIVIPAVAVATFALSQWVTTTFIDPAEH